MCALRRGGRDARDDSARSRVRERAASRARAAVRAEERALPGPAGQRVARALRRRGLPLARAARRARVRRARVRDALHAAHAPRLTQVFT